MAVQVKLDPRGLDRDLTAILAEVEGSEARSALLASAAREAIAQADDQNRAAIGRVPHRDIYVDDRLGVDLSQVKPDGTILVEYRLIDDALLWIQELLEKHSPIGKEDDPRPGHPGAYKASHVLTADGVAIQIRRGQPIPEAEEYAFVNTQPYARKIEKGLSSQSPNGVYQVVANLARGRFGNIAKIGFGYRAPEFGAISTWAKLSSARRLAKSARKGDPRAHDEWLKRQPAVIVQTR